MKATGGPGSACGGSITREEGAARIEAVRMDGGAGNGATGGEDAVGGWRAARGGAGGGGGLATGFWIADMSSYARG